ncbi:ComEC/Rec2 family competence protein [Aerococcaceae bacterium WGS1372]
MNFHWLFLFSYTYVLLQLLFHYNHWTLLVLLIIVFRMIKLNNYPVIITTMVTSLLILCVFSLQQSEQKYIEQLPIEEQEMIFQIESDPLDIEIDESMISGQGKATLIVEDKVIQFKVDYVQWLDNESIVNSQQLIEEPIWKVKGKFIKPNSARNFHVFDYKEFLKSKNIIWQLEIKDIERTSSVTQLSHRISQFRFKLLKFFRDYDQNEWAALHNKLLLNLDSKHYKEIKGNFLSLGVAHYFAISGFHIFYIRRMLRNTLLRLGMTTELSDIVVSLFLFVYLWLVRWPVGVIRVLFMKHLDDLFNFIGQPMSTIDRLSFSAVILLIVNPLYSLFRIYT